MSTSRSALRVGVAHLVYDVLFLIACLLAAPAWAFRASKDARHLRWAKERLGGLPPGLPDGRPVWIHAVSVGEVKAARPLVARLRARRPGLPIVLSTTTPTGRETAERELPELYVFHPPLDVAWIVRRVVRRIDPRLVVLLELEAWPSLMRRLDEAGVPQVIVNGRMTERSYQSYRRWRWWLPEFERLDLVAAQDELVRDRIADLGVPAGRLFVTGNVKHDLLVPAPRGRVECFGQQTGLAGDAVVFVAGSTHEGEEELALEAWARAGGGRAARLVLVPRHPERVREVERLLQRRQVPVRLRSAGHPLDDPGAVLLIDTMGELETAFGVASLVFLGGSLVPVGGHNVLEPAVAGCPVVVGPHLESCRREAERLEAAGGLVRVEDAEAFTRIVGELLADAPRRAAMGERARSAVAGLSGASADNVALLEERGWLGP